MAAAPASRIRVFRVDASEAKDAATAIAKAAVVLPGAVRVGLAAHAKPLQALIRRHASGRPGPRVRTGAYRNSIFVDMKGGNKFQSQLRGYSTHPASNRLEFGFSGVDAVGRSYNQPPYPHFGPALAEYTPILEQSMATLVKQSTVQFTYGWLS